MATSVLVLLALSAGVPTQLDLFDWSLDGNPSGSGSLAPSVMQVVGPDGGGCTPPITHFSAIAPVAGVVSVSVDFVNLDSGVAQGHPIYDAPAGWRNGTVLKAPPVAPGSQGGWPTGAYVVEFAVEAGDLFGLGVWSADCAEGPGIADFHDLVFTPEAWSGQPLALDPRVRFQLEEPTLASYLSSLSAAGDVDADGVPDLLAGRNGAALVLSGSDGHVAATLPGLASGDTAVAGAGDVDGDGHADLLVGSPFASPGGKTYAGSARLHSGADGSVLRSWDGGSVYDLLGRVVAGLGDTDGDGVGDLAIRVEKLGSDPESVLLVSGATGAVLREFLAPVVLQDFGAHLAGAGDVDGDGLNDVLIGADERAWAYSGASGALLHQLGGNLGDDVSVAAAGDVDADGHADLLLGAPHADAGGSQLGRVLVHSGADGGLLMTRNGKAMDGLFGHAVSGGGDHDGDGRLDVAVGAPLHAPGGRVFVLDALDGSPVAHLAAGFEGDGLGDQLVRPGDMDGDGRDELAASAPWAGIEDTGRLRVYGHLEHPGAPGLAGEGDLQAGSPVTLGLDHALPGQLVVLVLGAEFVKQPLLGGVLGPSPQWLLPLVADGAGELQLGGTWPAGLPPWYTLWMQAWILDAAGPGSHAASDALAASQL